jgi:hypothetical protein
LPGLPEIQPLIAEQATPGYDTRTRPVPVTWRPGAASPLQTGRLTEEVPMPSALAALTPPLLVAAAFLIAVGAFIRHEMRRGKNRTEDEQGADSAPDSSAGPDANEAGFDQSSFGERTADRDRDPNDPPGRNQ